MKPEYQIVDAQKYHCGRIVRRMRTAHLTALAPTGKDIHWELRATLGRSFFAKACIMDGKVIAMWGASGPVLGESAYVWLILSNDAVRFPIALMKEAVRQMKIILSQCTEVSTTVLAGDDAALRFATFLGFHDRHEDGVLSSRKDIANLVRTDPRIQFPAGNTFVMAVGCHSEMVH